MKPWTTQLDENRPIQIFIVQCTSPQGAMELSNQGRNDPSGLKGFKLLETDEKMGKHMEKWENMQKIYIYMFISPHDFAVDLFEDRPLNAKPFEAALAHHSSVPEIIDLIWWTLMDDLAFRIPGQGLLRIPGQGLASGKAVRKNPVPIHPRKGLYGSLVSLDGDKHAFIIPPFRSDECINYDVNTTAPDRISATLWPFGNQNMTCWKIHQEDPSGKSTIYTWIFKHLSVHCRHVLCSVWSMRSCSASGQWDIWSSDPRLNQGVQGVHDRRMKL